ncbi:MAG: deoxyguanosinetriphosphate triphosphohydrolase [Candidatus Muirbacterium halophilum]|nr:deoxyguanosinetriphosphate triphosphohydrolase [Candidatus Muirbacterium halophilum]MCK9475122.1 deoxyguanosinetriphosphate triphosphohydrolase [Candidatus Muirbacterium halophilum]
MEDLKIRQKIEAQEYKVLSSELACFAKNTKGRVISEDESPVRTCFQRDRDRIIHSSSFRRLKDKTQVFILSDFSHPRTRLTHTLEVAQIARTISRALDLNEDLTEAIALGHDLGHTPFGHLGERIIDSHVSFKFHHSLNSLRIVDYLEKEGKGLNLTFEVRDGIVKHSKSIKGIEDLVFGKQPFTSEAKVVRISDSIAYLNHDIDDSINKGIINIEELPEESLNIIGKRHGQRINTMVESVIRFGIENKKIGMEDNILKQSNILRNFMFENVYIKADETEASIKAVEMLEYIWKFYEYNKKIFFLDFNIKKEYADYERMLADNISFLTDNEVIVLYKRLKI